MKLKGRFKKLNNGLARDYMDVEMTETKPEVPEGMFWKCSSCGTLIYEEDFQKHFRCCPECGKHFRVDPWSRIRMTVDAGSFEEWDQNLMVKNPLEFSGYEEKIQKLQEKTLLKDAVVTGKGEILGYKVALGVMSSQFMMGSMGVVVGEKLTRMVERATKERLPIVIFCCSGGARMQEGIFSLMQMAKVSQALKCHDKEGLLYVSVLTDPTTGGVTASFAMLGDVIIAEPGAVIGFAGERVIQKTLGQKLPEGFQRAEFLQKHGFIDCVTERARMRKVLSVLLKSAGVTNDRVPYAQKGNK